MPSSWIVTRTTTQGAKRYRVEYRLGGRESATRYGGSFKRKEDANARKRWIDGELAARRAPDLHSLEVATQQAPTVTEAIEHWRASRVDVAEGTRVLHRVALNRVVPIIGTKRVDEITVDDINAMVTELAGSGRKKETIRKSVKYLAAVLEENGIDPNPARSKRLRLPHEEQEELNPPTAAHVEAVYRLLASSYRLPLLWLDWSGARVGSIDALQVGDYDERERRVRLRRSTTKTRAALWVELHPTLADRLEATLPAREDRDVKAKLFPDCSADRLRTAIARACRASGIPVFSPHDLRHRRISLLHAQGRSWAEIGRFVGQRKLSITADVYTHVLVDGSEVPYGKLLGSQVQ
jgi:integrase